MRASEARVLQEAEVNGLKEAAVAMCELQSELAATKVALEECKDTAQGTPAHRAVFAIMSASAACFPHTLSVLKVWRRPPWLSSMLQRPPRSDPWLLITSFPDPWNNQQVWNQRN